MTNHTHIITFTDAMELSRDNLVNQTVNKNRDNGGLTGIVTMRDEAGRIIFQKRHNLIVLRGRTFALEMIFHDPIGVNGVNSGSVPYVSDLGRKIIAFGVGRGGTASSDPFTPYAPPPTGTAGVQLSSPVPFRFHDTAQAASGDPTLYIPVAEIQNYGSPVPVPGSATQFNYYLKNFNTTPPAWIFNESLNTVYKQVMLYISDADCRTFTSNWVNELCLYISRTNGVDSNGGTVFVSPEMFSRITFPTEYLSVGKKLMIEYQVYA